MPPSPVPVAPSRPTVLAVAGSLLLMTLLLVAISGPVGVGEATTHARQHATVAAISVSIFALAGLFARPSGPGLGSRVWRAALVAFAFVALVQLIEGAGGMGYDEFNEGTRYSWLTAVHLVGVLATFVGYLAVLFSIMAGLVWLAGRATRSFRSS